MVQCKQALLDVPDHFKYCIKSPSVHEYTMYIKHRGLFVLSLSPISRYLILDMQILQSKRNMKTKNLLILRIFSKGYSI